MDAEFEYNLPRWKVVLTAILAGSLFGCGAIFMKLATAGIGSLTLLSAADWISLLTNRYFWLLLLVNFAGLLAWLKSLQEGKVTIVGPIVGGFIISVTVFSGITFFGETLTPMRCVGIIAIMAGALGLSRR